MREVVLASVALALVLAGCADAKGPAAASPAEDAPTGLGVLKGVVVDDAVRPLDGALVVASGASGTLNATTGPDGLFTFEDLAPGVYLVEASKRFYSAAQATVDVHEGVEAGTTKFQLMFQQDAVPFATVYKHEGF